MRLALVLVALLAAPFLAGCAEEPDSPSPNPTSPSLGGTPPAQSPTPTAGAADAECVSTTSDERAVEPTVVLETTQGTIRLTLFCDKAPVTARHIAKLVEAGCYDGTKFHRVVRGFMDQGGDPLSKDDAKQASWGTGGPADCAQSPDTIVEEYYCADGTVSTATPSGTQPPSQCDAHGGLGLRHDRAGVWSMARTNAPHTSGSQFFLTAAPASFLDGRYTVFGHAADQASVDVILKINNLPCRGQPCQDPNSRTDTLVVVERATIDWG